MSIFCTREKRRGNLVDHVHYVRDFQIQISHSQGEWKQNCLLFTKQAGNVQNLINKLSHLEELIYNFWKNYYNFFNRHVSYIKLQCWTQETGACCYCFSYVLTSCWLQSSVWTVTRHRLSDGSKPVSYPSWRNSNFLCHNAGSTPNEPPARLR